MPGYLERTVEFTPGPIGNFDAIADQIDPPLRPMGMTAMMAVHGGGESYDSTVEDFTVTGPRGDVDTPVGAGNITLDLLRYVSLARQQQSPFREFPGQNPFTGDTTTTLVYMPSEHPDEAAEYTEILGLAHHLQPVKAVAIQYTQERDPGTGVLLEPTTAHFNARLSHDPIADLKTAFTNVSIDDRRSVSHSLAHPNTRYLTVTTGLERSLSIRRPELPPSFHHVRMWTQLLQNIIGRG